MGIPQRCHGEATLLFWRKEVQGKYTALVSNHEKLATVVVLG